MASPDLLLRGQGIHHSILLATHACETFVKDVIEVVVPLTARYATNIIAANVLEQLHVKNAQRLIELDMWYLKNANAAARFSAMIVLEVKVVMFVMGQYVAVSVAYLKNFDMKTPTARN